MDEMYVALLGRGTVGTGVYKVMKTQESQMQQKLNTVLRIGRILVRDPKKHEGEVDDPSVLTSSYEDIISDMAANPGHILGTYTKESNVIITPMEIVG